jgi:ATP adenylyltransferase
MAVQYPQILYAHWRYEYSKISPPGKYQADPFVGLESGDEKKHGIIKKGKFACLLLNKFPYAPGHLLAVPYRKVGPIEKLTVEELAEIMEFVVLGKKLLTKIMHIHGCNIGLNQGDGDVSGGSVPEHLHFHIVPRWKGDNSFLPVIGGPRLMIRSSESIWCEMKKVLAQMEKTKALKKTKVRTRRKRSV